MERAPDAARERVAADEATRVQVERAADAARERAAADEATRVQVERAAAKKQARVQQIMLIHDRQIAKVARMDEIYEVRLSDTARSCEVERIHEQENVAIQAATDQASKVQLWRAAAKAARERMAADKATRAKEAARAPEEVAPQVERQLMAAKEAASRVERQFALLSRDVGKVVETICASERADLTVQEQLQKVKEATRITKQEIMSAVQECLRDVEMVGGILEPTALALEKQLEEDQRMLDAGEPPAKKSKKDNGIEATPPHAGSVTI